MGASMNQPPSGSSQGSLTSTGNTEPVQAEMMLNVLEAGKGWGPYPSVILERPLNEKFIMELPGAYYRIKARRKKGTTDELNYPWTDDWVYFWAGKAQVSLTEALKMQQTSTTSRETSVDLRHIKDQRIKPAGMPAARKMPGAIQPDLTVENITATPIPLKAGVPVNLSIKFKNTGMTANDTSYKYKTVCTVLSGVSQCPVPNTVHTLNKSIQPGATDTINLVGTIPAKAGSYKVLVVSPYNKIGGIAPSIILNITPTLKPGPRIQTVPQPDRSTSPDSQQRLQTIPRR
jgi:hypothetical protein